MLESNITIHNKQVLLLVSALGLTTVAWMAAKFLFGSNDSEVAVAKQSSKELHEDETDLTNFVQLMEKQNRKVAIFFGSQTGTAEEYAKCISKEVKRRFNVTPQLLDIEQCDMKYLDQFPEDGVAIFVMATYGEGEPTDNAQAFWDLLEAPEFSQGDQDKPLEQLRYFIFGLGNSSYAYFNWVAKVVDEKLTALGATRIGERGVGDDDKSLEEDFENWLEDTWPLLSDMVDVGDASSSSSGPDSAYTVEELESYDKHVYSGELGDQAQAIWDAKKPFPAAITSSYDLLTGSDRHCLHLEVDITGSYMSYTTGDHIAVWPSNNDVEILRLAHVFGLDSKLDTVISVKAVDETASKKSPFPEPTTYRAMLRHYLDICQLPSRQVLQMLVPYCPTPEIAAAVQKLVNDKDEHRQVVLDAVRNLAEVLEYAAAQAGATLPVVYSVPPNVLIECFSRLQPRYYSISSSSSESPNKVTITAVTLKFHPDPTPDRTVFGVNTNYLWAVHNALDTAAPANKAEEEDQAPAYTIEGPNCQYFDHNLKVAKLPVHIRRSNFKLPVNSARPVIMIGPGTGVAPFRGFVRERVFQKTQQGLEVGPTILFFGSRRTDEDFLYKDEWSALFDALGAPSRLITAFSRETAQKVYVQHRLQENSEEMWDLIHNKRGYIYVCGDARHMAKDVQKVITEFAVTHGGYSEAEAEKYVQQLRDDSRYQEDVWA